MISFSREKNSESFCHLSRNFKTFGPKNIQVVLCYIFLILIQINISDLY